MMTSLYSTVLTLWISIIRISSQSQWTSGQYPDLRGPTVTQCAAVLPRNKQHMYICDPDRILNNSQGQCHNIFRICLEFSVLSFYSYLVIQITFTCYYTIVDSRVDIASDIPAMSLNRQLHDLAVGTPCHCQRRSQCTTGMPGTETEGFHGFVVSVAIVQNLQMQIHSPSEA
ncbi:hypothetical protein ANCDUO_22363 [Ancylostoma duodenale]|uniref:Uncharacterized protein n=1 Tax=Ancylostoma duodenale TaxID=51022 RepID=A0A0C2FLC9_9BILA|nr:hypothetical protein ANCDUO_22363 [Ancylostoma duodenale]